jgi:hypothetical protein
MVKSIGAHVRLMDVTLLAVVNGINEQNKLLVARLPDLTPSEGESFLTAIRQNETQAERLEAASRDFQNLFEAWLNGN